MAPLRSTSVIVMVDVIPTPGHNETEVSFNDRGTGWMLTGDFLMLDRLLIDDTRADVMSADRVAAFVSGSPDQFCSRRTYRNELLLRRYFPGNPNIIQTNTSFK